VQTITGQEQTTTIERASLVFDVNATGRVTPEQNVALAFKTSGRVSEILVKEGDLVERGQVLATLETANLQQALLQAEATLRSAQAQLAKAKAGSRPEEIAGAEAAAMSAQVGVRAADKAVEIARGNVAVAQASLSSAQASLNKLVAGPTALEIKIAEKQVEAAKNSLWGLQGQRDALGGPGGSSAQREAAQAQVASQESQIAIAQLQLEQLRAGSRPEDIAVARAQVEQAKASLQVAEAQLGQAETQVESAKAQAQQAQAQLDLLRSGLLAEDIAVAESQVAQAEAGLRQAQLALQDATLIAPLRGVVAQINSQVNELVTVGQPVLVLVDDSMYHITVSVDEADIGQISEQQTVEVTLDAYPGQTMEGKVARIAPVSSTEGGIVAYKVRVDLMSGEIPMREGLTANAKIVTKRMEDVLVIPNEAILVDENSGSKFAARVVGGTVNLVPIETGYQTDVLSQITSGLEEGDVVVLRSSSYRERFRGMMSGFGKSTFGSQ